MISGSQVLRILQPAVSFIPALFYSMTYSNRGGGDFDLFEALCSQPDLLELVVQQCSGRKNDLRLACSRLRAAVDACVTGMTWMTLDRFKVRAKHMVVLARCPRLQTLNFNGSPAANLSPLAAFTNLRTLCNLIAEDIAPLAALTHLSFLSFDDSIGLTDISPLSACTALQFLECSGSRIRRLPLLAASLHTMWCSRCPFLSDISALVACKALTYLFCTYSAIARLPPLPAGLTTLDICGTRCADLSALAACTGLQVLHCGKTPVQDLTPLATCSALQSLHCTDTRVDDLMPLLACSRLQYLRCDGFAGVEDQTNRLFQINPGLKVKIGSGR